MDFADEVKQRLERGQAASTYIELIDIDEVDGLSDAYLSIHDGKHLPAQPSPPLTSDEFKRYVRLVYDAIKSVDMASDVFVMNQDGSIVQSTPKEYLDSVTMFEIQLVAGRLVKAVHRVQFGTITMPSSTPSTDMHFHKYSSFPERMNTVISALETWKSFGMALFTDDGTMENRLAMDPEGEVIKKLDGENNGTSSNQQLELQIAEMCMPEPEKPAAMASNDEAVDDNKNADGTPASGNKKRRLGSPDAVLINPGDSRGSNRGAKRQLAAPAASPSTPANAGPSVQSTSLAALSSDVASDSIQPAASATPTANNTAGSVQPGTYTSEYLQLLSQAYYEKHKFPGPMGTPVPQYGDQSPRLGGPGTNQRPLAQMPQLPQTPQPAHLPGQHPHQQHQPPPDYLASQRAAYGYQQCGPQRNNPFAQASQQSQVHGAQGFPAQNPRHQQAPQHGGVMGSDSPLGSASPYSNEVNIGSGSANFERGGTVVYGVYGSGVVNNYIQSPTPSPPGDQDFASPRDGSNQAPGNYFGRGNSGIQDDNQGESERDNSLPPGARGNSPPQVPTADAKVGDQDQEDDGDLPALHPSNYSLPPGLAPPAVAPGLAPPAVAAAARHSPAATSSAPAPKKGFSLGLADETLDDALAALDCRRVARGLPPTQTTGWRDQDGDQDEPFDLSQGIFFNVEEEDWDLGPKEADDNFVPFREASEEWDFDFLEKGRNRVNNESGDKEKPEEESRNRANNESGDKEKPEEDSEHARDI